MFWCKIRSKCALVSHIHAPKVGQFLSAGNQGQVVYVINVMLLPWVFLIKLTIGHDIFHKGRRNQWTEMILAMIFVFWF